MRPELTTLADWLCSSGRMAHVHYGRLLREVQQILERTLFMINGSTNIDVEGLASALPTVDTHLEAAVVDHDPAALVFLLEGLIPLRASSATTRYDSSWLPVCSPTRRSTTGPPR